MELIIWQLTIYFKNSTQDIENFQRRLTFYANQYKLDLLDTACYNLINWALAVYEKVRPITITAIERDHNSHGYFYYVKESRALYSEKNHFFPHLAHPFFSHTTMQYVANHQDEYKKEYQQLTNKEN